MDDGMDTSMVVCITCDNMGSFYDGEDGFYYCRICHTRAEGIMDMGIPDEDFMDADGGGIYQRSHRRSQPTRTIKPEPISQEYLSQFQSQSSLDPIYLSRLKAEEERLEDEIDDREEYSGPRDFGLKTKVDKPDYEDYYEDVRMKYVAGVQMMIQYQCEALVKKFNVCPLICGLTGSIWLRYLTSLKVFDENWCDEVTELSESQGTRQHKKNPKYENEPYSMYGKRLVMVWFRHLRKQIPLHTSLAVSYLACHVAREAVIPTDIVRWTREGKLPYFNAFVDLGKYFGPATKTCPLSVRSMFRPRYVTSCQKLESTAASIASLIGLKLPPVNFSAIAARYLKQLSLPVENILPHACRVCEWSMSPDLWLSANVLRLPTRVCVMSILIVTIRILFNLNGFGKWEQSVRSLMIDQEVNTDFSCGSNTDATDEKGDSPTVSNVYRYESDAPKLLLHLEKVFRDMKDEYDYMKDLPSYLQHAGEVLFAGMEEDREQNLKKQIESSNRKRQKDLEVPDIEFFDCEPYRIASPQNGSEGTGHLGTPSKASTSAADVATPTFSSTGNRSPTGHASSQRTFTGDNDNLNSVPKSMDAKLSRGNLKDARIRRLKLDMEEHRFHYIPPRVKVKKHYYLRYRRKRDRGCLAYVAHADYYILLRACARAAKVDVRIMHAGVSRLETRLAWLEKRIDHCLKLKGSDVTVRSEGGTK